MKNLFDIMKQASQIKAKMEEMQSVVEAITETGTAGAGLVTVSLNGKGALTEIKIDRSLLRESEGEILEDLIVAAHADAKAKIEQTLQDKMQQLTGGLSLPPGLKLF